MRHDYSMHSANPDNVGEGTIPNHQPIEIANPAPVDNPYAPDNNANAVQVSPVPSALRSATLVENAQRPYTWWKDPCWLIGCVWVWTFLGLGVATTKQNKDVGGDVIIWCLMFLPIAIWLAWGFKTGVAWPKLKMRTAIVFGAWTTCIWGLIANRVFINYWFLDDLEKIDMNYIIPLSGDALEKFGDSKAMVNFISNSQPLSDAVVCDGGKCFSPILSADATNSTTSTFSYLAFEKSSGDVESNYEIDALLIPECPKDVNWCSREFETSDVTAASASITAQRSSLTPSSTVVSGWYRKQSWLDDKKDNYKSAGNGIVWSHCFIWPFYAALWMGILKLGEHCGMNCFYSRDELQRENNEP